MLDPFMVITDNMTMQISYTQFCLEQMKVPTWRLRSNRYARVANQQQEEVGHILLAATEDSFSEEVVMELVVAMLKAIDLSVGAFQYGLPPKSLTAGLVLIMGNVGVERDWAQDYSSQHLVVHPSEMIQNSALKREAWNTLKSLKKQLF